MVKVLSSNYVLLNCSEADKEILKYTLLTEEDKRNISELKERFKKRKYALAIEDLYKLHKNYYPTSKIALMYGVGVRQIQRIFTELGLNRDKSMAMIISSNDNLKYEDKSLKKVPLITSTPIKDLELPSTLQNFLIYLSTIKGKSPNTVDGYKMDLILFFRFIKRHKGLYPKNTPISNIAIGDIDKDFIKSINLTDFYAFLSFLENDRKNTSYTRARKVAALKSFFKFLQIKAKILDENPTEELEAPKILKRHPVYLSLEESKELLSSVDYDEKHPKRDFCILTLFLNCGLRLSELCSINISSIKDDTLTIIGKGNKERTVYLNHACIKAISAYMRERNIKDILPQHKDALFISDHKSRINKSTIQKIIKKYITLAGLDPEKYSTHKLRHTAATLMYKYGNVDIRSLQMILGHENINTTQIYTHVDDEKLREAVALNPLSDEDF